MISRVTYRCEASVACVTMHEGISDEDEINERSRSAATGALYAVRQRARISGRVSRQVLRC
jgi:hypothetical protein